MKTNDWAIDYPCPECKQTFRVTLYQMSEGGVMVCPTCKMSNARAELCKLEVDLENIGTSIRNLKNCLEVHQKQWIDDLG